MENAGGSTTIVCKADFETDSSSRLVWPNAVDLPASCESLAWTYASFRHEISTSSTSYTHSTTFTSQKVSNKESTKYRLFMRLMG